LVARVPVPLADVYAVRDEGFCTILDKCREVSLDLLARAPLWIDID
jgi:hypothetical protein